MMKEMRKIISLVLILILAMNCVSCGSNQSVLEEGPKDQVIVEPEQESVAQVEGESREKNKKILVIYFSRTGEQYNVGVIEKGNTAIVAEIIAEMTDADLFEVLPVEDYYPKEKITVLHFRRAVMFEGNAFFYHPKIRRKY